MEREREDLKVAPCTCQNHALEYQTIRDLCTRWDYLQRIKRITAESERALLYYCWY